MNATAVSILNEVMKLFLYSVSITLYNSSNTYMKLSSLVVMIISRSSSGAATDSRFSTIMLSAFGMTYLTSSLTYMLTRTNSP